jgi:hypothetical protein
MGGDLENKLVAAFEYFDFDKDGTINREDLTEICKRLEPSTWNAEKVDGLLKGLDTEETGYVNFAEFAVWVTSGAEDGKRVLTIYEAELAKKPGERLADGDKTDAGMDVMRSNLSNVLTLKPEEYTHAKKALTKLSSLRTVVDLLDPTRNPCGFRICQSACVEHEAIGPLLGLAHRAQSDAVVNKSLEVLARTSFGNEEAAAAIADHEEFLPTLRTVLATAKQPEKLCMLQLVQAVAAASAAPRIQQALPGILAEVVPLLAERSFMVLPMATFDVLVSASFAAPAAIVDTVSWTELADWFAEDLESGRPVWLDQENLTVLASGLLAANLLALPTPPSFGESELQARDKVLRRLGTSGFLEFFALAMEAAVERREWPAHSGAFHSVSRLSSVTSVLASVGYRSHLVSLVEPLAKAVETSLDECSTRLALTALRNLVDDLACLEAFSTLIDFRSETLDMLHKTGDEKEATELLACVTAAEDAMAVAQAAFDDSVRNAHPKNPPSVKYLAELFNELSPMDGELTLDQMLQILPRVPVGPAKDVKLSLQGEKTSKFSFASLANHVYGTPTLLGWWQSLMEDTSSMWNDAKFQEVQPPPMSELLSYYELGAKGGSGVTSERILQEVLPSWHLPVEGDLVEDLFCEIRGDTPLSFKDFAKWMCRYFQAVAKQREEAEKADADAANVEETA